jgi:hypothetical protein
MPRRLLALAVPFLLLAVPAAPASSVTAAVPLVTPTAGLPDRERRPHRAGRRVLRVGKTTAYGFFNVGTLSVAATPVGTHGNSVASPTARRKAKLVWGGG